jgi:uncharacterized protein (DUF2235 family)
VNGSDGRRLVLCFDGTNNQFGPENTNVIRLVQVLDRDAARQRLYYEPGVGTLPEPGVLTRLGKRVSELFGLAFGAGLLDKVQEAYGYLMDHWEPGDQVFLFGFSRGAYTARVLAGLLHTLGLMPRGGANMLPYVTRLYRGTRGAGARGAAGSNEDYWTLCDEFRWTFARPVPGDKADQRRFPVHFLGVWDTVSSVGWVWDPATYRFTAHNPSIAVIRHAVSIDERRWFFRQNLMGPEGGQDFQERWFPGVHGDVGGGYPEGEGGLWRVAFRWLLEEARTAGLLIDEARLERVWERSPVPERPWDEPQHESLRGWWWLAEFFPKFRRGPAGWKVPRLGRGRHRVIPAGALIDRAALRRVRETAYAPPNFPARFLEQVRALTDESLPLPG